MNRHTLAPRRTARPLPCQRQRGSGHSGCPVPQLGSQLPQPASGVGRAERRGLVCAPLRLVGPHRWRVVDVAGVVEVLAVDERERLRRAGRGAPPRWVAGGVSPRWWRRPSSRWKVSRRSSTFFTVRTWASPKARGSSAGSGSSPMPQVGSPCGSSAAGRGVRGDPAEQRRQVCQVGVHRGRRHRLLPTIGQGADHGGRQVIAPQRVLAGGHRGDPVVPETVEESLPEPPEVPGDGVPPRPSGPRVRRRRDTPGSRTLPSRQGPRRAPRARSAPFVKRTRRDLRRCSPRTRSLCS